MAKHEFHDSNASLDKVIKTQKEHPWRNVGLILLFWLVVFLVMVGQTTSGFSEWSRVVVEDLAVHSIWVLISLMLYALSSRFAFGSYSGAVLVLLYGVVGLVVTFLVDTMHTVVHVTYVHSPRRRTSLWEALSEQAADEVFRLHQLEYLIYLAIVFAILAGRAHQRSRERQLNEERLRAQLTEARLVALRTQLNPHFLFNTLHAVSAFVEHKPEVVHRLLARLSDLLRYTLQPNLKHEVPLSQELVLLGYYLDILLLRFDSSLDIQREIDPEVLDVFVPDLILQPLVENAIEHGLSKLLEDGVIRIGAEKIGNQVRLYVRDNGCGIDEYVQEGVGLQNTRARLNQLYGESGSMELTVNEDGGTTVTILVPFNRSTSIETERAP